MSDRKNEPSVWVEIEEVSEEKVGERMSGDVP
jgi:hypothetical protein